jgi:hypothetical protein
MEGDPLVRLLERAAERARFLRPVPLLAAA